MDDIEKTRVEYVVRLEEQVIHLKRQLDAAKPLADKWTPVVNSENLGDSLRITMAFGGKRATASIKNDTLLTSDATSLTSSVVDSMIQNLVFNQLTPIVRPIIDAAQYTVGQVDNAGKW
ncbi:MAG: hypothetical protein DDT31_01379 [Syntrophomonadaceae bacterium]|nr:hypothetical protein [Bacillota bacterium]